MSKREIARSLDISRNTVEKILSKYDKVIKGDNPEEGLEDLLTIQPKYDSSKRVRRKLTDEIKSVIDECLKKNAAKIAMGLRKQRMLKKDIFLYLQKLGHDISYPTVCNYVRSVSEGQKTEKKKETYIRLYYEPGGIVEFDWRELILFIGGERVKFYIAVFTFAHSNGRYAYIFRHQNMLAFMTGILKDASNTKKIINMTIRKATLEDIPRMQEIFAIARRFMAETGNPNQWADTYPSVEQLTDDISSGDSYVCLKGGKIVGTFVLRSGNDPTYDKIYDGAWKNDNPYATIHRIASSGEVKGIFNSAMAFAFQHYDTIRIDTYRDNRVMQNAIQKAGFEYCGIIHCWNGDERLAYQYN